jgi:hypothetical protein
MPLTRLPPAPAATAAASLGPAVHRQAAIAGLLGSMYGRHEDAEIVNDAIEEAMPDRARYRLARATAKSAGGDTSLAHELLAAQADADAGVGNDRAMVRLAAALMLGGDEGWRALVDRVLALSDDVPARSAASVLLDFVDGLPARRRAAG